LTADSLSGIFSGVFAALRGQSNKMGVIARKKGYGW
jgi:hypothetical protein